MKIRTDETTQSSAIHCDANAGHMNMGDAQEDIKKKTRKLVKKLSGKKDEEK